ncbi:hypothetical protein [Pseudonocardia acaciae]|uniref:hypothetical protein n=1 Tax=Pseudonocardia acaciae TaxID=551276 RepID=UPI00048CE885|nr:hypothetical protein [Pseudonocardia acaciae]
MERGSDKHGPRKDDKLASELDGQLQPKGGHREEWADPEPPADDDPEPMERRRPDPRPGGT